MIRMAVKCMDLIMIHMAVKRKYRQTGTGEKRDRLWAVLQAVDLEPQSI